MLINIDTGREIDRIPVTPALRRAANDSRASGHRWLTATASVLRVLTGASLGPNVLLVRKARVDPGGLSVPARWNRLSECRSPSLQAH